MSGDHTERKYEWLRSEQDLANERLSAYTEADQKIIVVVGAVIVAVAGLASIKPENFTHEAIPYVLFLASAVMALAIIQSSLYSSLALIYLERKYHLAKRMGELLQCDPDLALTHGSLFRISSQKSYEFGVVPYYLVKMSIGLVLCAAGYFFSAQQQQDFRFVFSFMAALVISILAALVVLSQAIAADGVVKKLMRGGALTPVSGRRWLRFKRRRTEAATPTPS